MHNKRRNIVGEMYEAKNAYGSASGVYYQRGVHNEDAAITEAYWKHFARKLVRSMKS